MDTPADLAGEAFLSTLQSKAEGLKSELIRQTLADLESWVKAIDAEYHTAHPDRTDDIVIQGSPGWVYRTQAGHSSEQIIPEAELEAYRNRIRNDYYEWVVPTLTAYGNPDPDAANAAIDALRTIESMFGGSQSADGSYQTSELALTRINDVRTEMGHWEGTFKTNFVDNFVSPLQNTFANQALAAKVARELLELNKVTYIAQRKGILELIDRSLKALGELSKDKDPDSYTWCTLVGIAAGTLLTGGTGLVAWAGVALITTSTLAQGMVPDPITKTEIGAPTAQEIAVNITEALRKQDVETAKDEDDVRRAFQTFQGDLASARGATGELKVPRPDLHGASIGEVRAGLKPAG